MEPPPTDQQNFNSWLAQNSIRLATVGAGAGFTDLQPLRGVIGGARIVALGEATHGTREFFQLKHRLLEFLVSEMGFTTFAIEANWPESLVVNEYVLHGRGDPFAALAGLKFWTWNTQEVFEMIKWMRRHNADAHQNNKVSFAGIDAQFTSVAAKAVEVYLTRVDPDFAQEIGPQLMLFEKESRDYTNLAESERQILTAVVHSLTERFKTEQQAYVSRSTAREWGMACQHARILRQVDMQRRATDNKTRFMARDQAMAENVGWILDDAGLQGKVVVWAHNAHIARDPRGIFDGAATSMGMHLADRFGPQLVVVGLAFGAGAFQAVVKERDGRRPIREVVVGPPPEGSLDNDLARSGIPLFLLDLRGVLAAAAPWIARPRITREIGAFFEHEDDMLLTIVPSARYDVLAFVWATTRARPNPRSAMP